MKRWRKQVRFAMIAVAGFVLLVTVLPQVASGIGLGGLASRLASTTSCSGSSDSSGSSGSSDSSSSCCSGSSGSSDSSGSSGCVTGPGTVSGTVTLTGAPAGFVPSLFGVGACPSVSPGQPLCAFPQYGLVNSGSSGSYNLSLSPGTWVLYGFYESAFLGGAFTGSPNVVSVTSGANRVLDTTVPYVKPATLDVTVSVTGLPAGAPVTSAYTVLCPTGIPYDGTTQPLPCVQGGNPVYPPSPTPGTFSITGLPPGQWTAYPGYCTQFGCAANPNAGKQVTLHAGRTSRVHLTTGFVVPPNGQLTATATVVGAPPGFNDPVGLMACQTGQYGYCEGFSSSGSGPMSLFLPDGAWTVTAFYTVQPFGNAVSGSAQTIVIQGGQTTTVSLQVTYQVLGTAAGTIRVTGMPANVHPTSYSVRACPVGSSNPFTFLSCVYEYSGAGGGYGYGAADTKRLGKNAHRGTLPKSAGVKINTFNLPTLTPGLWDIQASYTTPFGTFSPQNDTVVRITSGQTTTTRVKIPYQQPFGGIVKGTLTVVNLPGSSNTTVRACTSDPSGGSCTGEVDGYPGSGGTYQLQLPPGTWWVQGVAYVYSGFTTQTIASPARQVAVTTGSQTKANFTVTGP